MSLPLNVYQIARPSQFNPEFIGIAQKLAQAKHYRIKIQKKHKQLSNTVNYTIKLNDSLQKSLEQKEKQLLRLKKIRSRHSQDIQNKLKQQFENKKRIQNLRQKAQFQRKTMKSNLKNQKQKLKQQRRAIKNQIKIQHQRISQQIFNNENERIKKNHNMYLTIKTNQLRGNNHVDTFFRKKNLQSLNSYKQSISDEKKKKQFYKNDIKKMNQLLNIFNHKTQKKQNKLKKIQNQINQYSNLSQFYTLRGKTGIGYRDQTYSSVSSRKPSQILLMTSQNFRSKIQQSFDLLQSSKDCNPEI